MSRSKRNEEQPAAASTHLDHLEAREDHGSWLKDIERWRSEYEQAIHRFASRLLPDLELSNYRDGMDRHEAAILAHEELVARHEERLRREKSGHGEHADEADALHEQMHQRHEVSRIQHEQLSRAHRAILQALAMFEADR